MRSRYQNFISRFSLNLLDFFLPQLCLFCGAAPSESKQALCSGCEARIDWVASPLCPRCGRIFPVQDGADHLCGLCQTEPPPFAQARAAALYEGPAAEAIKKFKYGRRMDVLPVLQHWLNKPACKELVDAAEILMPVPLHTKRLQARGFNQALFLAQAFPELPLAREALVRVRHTPPQTGLNPKERRENVHRAFVVPRPDEVNGKNILLIDDVYTTGATVKECARVLLRAGAREVNVLTVARVRYD